MALEDLSFLVPGGEVKVSEELYYRLVELQHEVMSPSNADAKPWSELQEIAREINRL